MKNLHPAFKLRVWALIGILADRGIALRITAGFRTRAEQQILWEPYKLFKAGKGPRAPTAAPPGRSWHQWGLAIDVVPYKDLNNNQRLNLSELNWASPWWKDVGEVASRLGMRWGASFGDKPHIEWHPNLSLDDTTEGRPSIDHWGFWAHA